MNKTTKYQFLIVCLVMTLAYSCKKSQPAPPAAPSVTTSALTNVTTTSATAGGTITGDGGSAITASGIVLSKYHTTPTITDTVMTATATTGSFTVNLTSLDFATTYYLRAYATNSVGTSYGDVVTLNTTNDTSKVRFTYNGATVTYGIIISPTTSKKWMDRNLGASQVATSITDAAGYGDLFEWGRGIDGHQLRTSGKTTTPSSIDVPTHGNFIYDNEVPPATGWYDWRIPQNNNLWQGSSGINNPCPAGWHVPTRVEWTSETGISNAATGFSVLKLPLAGYRSDISGDVNAGSLGTQGTYWSSTISTQAAYRMSSTSSGAASISTVDRDLGCSIRCIKD